MTHLSPEARESYDLGIAPLDFIEGEVEALVRTWDMFRTAARTCGGVFPGGLNLSAEELARVITAAFLNAGWVAPVPEVR